MGKSQQDHGHKWIDKLGIQWHYCKMYGHYKSECRKLQFVQSRNKANVASIECEMFDALFLASNLNEGTYDKNTWLLDNGCSNHMTCHKDLFSSLDISINFVVKLGDHSQIHVLGKVLCQF